MALLNNPLLAEPENQSDAVATQQSIINAPKKVGERPVEVVQPKFDADASKQFLDFAKSSAPTGSVSNDSLVQTQLNKILANDGPLLKRARVDGLNASAEKGLNNASMGVQAGEEAVYRSALPIAQQDAQTYGNMDLQNAKTASDFSLAGVNQAFTDYGQNKQLAFTKGENDADRAQRESLQKDDQLFKSEQAKLSDDRQLASNKELQELKAKQDVALEDIKFAHDTTLQNNQAAKNVMAGHQNAIAAIIGNPSMTPSQASAAIKMINATTNSNLDLIGKLDGVDLSAFKASGNVTGTSTKDKKGNVTNTFTYEPGSPSSSSGSDQSLITIPNVGTMTRAEAIAKGYIR